MNAKRSLLRMNRDFGSFLNALATQLLVGYDLRPMIEELRSMLDDVPCPTCGGVNEHRMSGSYLTPRTESALPIGDVFTVGEHS